MTYLLFRCPWAMSPSCMLYPCKVHNYVCGFSRDWLKDDSWIGSPLRLSVTACWKVRFPGSSRREWRYGVRYTDKGDLRLIDRATMEEKLNPPLYSEPRRIAPDVCNPIGRRCGARISSVASYIRPLLQLVGREDTASSGAFLVLKRRLYGLLCRNHVL